MVSNDERRIFLGQKELIVILEHEAADFGLEAAADHRVGGVAHAESGEARLAGIFADRATFGGFQVLRVNGGVHML